MALYISCIHRYLMYTKDIFLLSSSFVILPPLGNKKVSTNSSTTFSATALCSSMGLYKLFARIAVIFRTEGLN